jgi:hypothetical protein
MSFINEARVRLLSNSLAQTTVNGSALPPAHIDPNPLLTEALHSLWQRLRVFVFSGEVNFAYRPPSDEPNLSVADALSRIAILLVSFLLLSRH